jgi:uncharacterized membrane protein
MSESGRSSDTPRIIDAGFIPGGRTVSASRGWDWFVSGFALFQREPLILVVMVIALLVCWVTLSWLPLIGALLNALLFQIFLGGIMLGCQSLDAGGMLRFGHLFAGFDRYGTRLAVIGIFAAVGVVVAVTPMILIVGIGSFKAMAAAATIGDMESLIRLVITLSLVLMMGLLTALALAVPLTMALWFAPALIVLHDLKPGAALAASFVACLKNTVPFLVYGIILALLMVIAVIPAGLGLLVLGPVVIASIYTAQRDIFFAGA